MRQLLAMALCVIISNVPLGSASGQEASPNATHLDITYRKVGNLELKLDLYVPDAKPNRPKPCVVFIHGGGWKNGNKDSGLKRAAWLTHHGFAVASIEYRLTDLAIWPAQINDCYAAIRWLREHAVQYNIAGSRIGVWGTSAGGHLASLIGTRRCPNAERTSSRVQAVCDWFGPSELMTMPPNNVGPKRTEEDVANSNGAKLLGKTVRENPALAADASPLDNVTSDDAPFLIVHGELDPGVPLEQSQKLHAALVRSGVSSRLEIVANAKHGGKEFDTEPVRQSVLNFFRSTLVEDWPQGSGAGGQFAFAAASPPESWSASRDENIAWRKTLPETGQSTVVGAGDRIFFTTYKPLGESAEVASDIVAWCCDASTGETLWTREIPATHPLRLSGCFGDSTSPPPVTDGKVVCFFNASGAIACFDIQGTPMWQNDMMPVSRTQPFLLGDKVAFIKQSYMPDEHGHFTHEHKNAPLDQWTQLQALDLATGEPAWSTTCGVNMGSGTVPLILPDGRQVIVVGRGGGHSPPETPEGISMVDARTGNTIWTLALPGFMATQTYFLAADSIVLFDAGDHLWVDVLSGKIVRRQSIIENISVRAREGQPTGVDRWNAETRTLDLNGKKRAIIQHSNVLARSYHYFRSYTQPWLGRIHVITGKVEYLQLPVQLRRETGGSDAFIWHWSDMEASVAEQQMATLRKKPKELPIQLWGFAPNSMLNSAGHIVMGDARSRGIGWGHYATAAPTVIGNQLYIPTMAGTVYVIDATADVLDEQAIVAINDLGPVGESWNRASLSYIHGRLYSHTIREIVCIGNQ